jgi:hypothetical protein
VGERDHVGLVVLPAVPARMFLRHRWSWRIAAGAPAAC